MKTINGVNYLKIEEFLERTKELGHFGTVQTFLYHLKKGHFDSSLVEGRSDKMIKESNIEVIINQIYLGNENYKQKNN